MNTDKHGWVGGTACSRFIRVLCPPRHSQQPNGTHRLARAAFKQNSCSSVSIRGLKLLLFLPLVALSLAGCVTGKNGRVFTITDYGAKDDPTVSNTDAFRRAITDCQKAGGGI